MNTAPMTHLTKSGRPCRIVRRDRNYVVIQFADSEFISSYAFSHLRPITSEVAA